MKSAALCYNYLPMKMHEELFKWSYIGARSIAFGVRSLRLLYKKRSDFSLRFLRLERTYTRVYRIYYSLATDKRVEQICEKHTATENVLLKRSSQSRVSAHFTAARLESKQRVALVFWDIYFAPFS